MKNLIILIFFSIVNVNSQYYYINLPSNNITKIQLSTVSLSSWTAKAYWDGSNYNKTGLILIYFLNRNIDKLNK